jgi:hypothetical protein
MAKQRSVAPEEVMNRLKQTIESLRTNLAVSEHSMNEALEKLRMDYGIESIEEGIETVERIDKELQAKEEELAKTANEISTAMESYL